MKKQDYYIGIDPDVKASGFAVWNKTSFIELDCYDLTDLLQQLQAYHDHNHVMVRLEAGWLSKGLNWHRGGYGSANRVGRNHEIGRQIEKYCVKEKIPYELVKPLGYSGYTHQDFCMYTKWPKEVKTNSETRVAGMLVYGFK